MSRTDFTRQGLIAWLLIISALLIVVLLVLSPLVVVFVEALAKGASVYPKILQDPETMSALRLSVVVTAMVVLINVLAGVAISWLVTKFRFHGRQVLLTLLDLPLAVSPVVAGLLLVLLFGSRGFFANQLSAANLKIIFATPGIVLATIFVTLPLVARILIPVMEAQGSEKEEAALTLGASGWQVFRLVTLPSIALGLAYGAILCNARALGEFGAVSVVSGHIRGQTNTLPLHIEILYNEYQFAAAFAVASLLSLVALATIGVQMLIERRAHKNLRRI